MSRKTIGIVGGALVVAMAAAALFLQQTAPNGAGRAYAKVGETTYAFATAPNGRGSPVNDCVVCHSIDRSGPMRSAPSLYGIVGAPKARSDWFAYSQPLRKKGGVWSPEDLDKYLADPSGFIPGTAKTLPPIEDAARRRDIISFLTSLHG